MLQRKIIGVEQAMQKLRHYCAYQERSHFEVREKLYSLGLRKQDVELCIATLIEEDYLNESRFAIAFAGGKFRVNKWGKVKIRQAMKEKRVSEYCINQALAEIPSDAYQSTMEKLTEKKWRSLKTESNIFLRLRKTRDYMLQKGYESQLVAIQLNSLRETVS